MKSWSKDTEYGGILYRSQLEAQWAQFFDLCKIRHKYEFEKVDLGVDKYTPDFWLPDFEVWIEVKPYKQYRPHSKCYRCAIETRKQVLLVQGKPERETVDVFNPHARRRFVHRTVVSKEEIRPAVENLRFLVEYFSEDKIVLAGHGNVQMVVLEKK